MIEGEGVRSRYTNQFISRCDDLIESVLGEGLYMYIGGGGWGVGSGWCESQLRDTHLSQLQLVQPTQYAPSHGCYRNNITCPVKADTEADKVTFAV
jgi:hypothetical protein